MVRIFFLLQYFAVGTDMEYDQQTVLCDSHFLPQITLGLATLTYLSSNNPKNTLSHLYRFPSSSHQLASERRQCYSLYLHASLHTSPEKVNFIITIGSHIFNNQCLRGRHISRPTKHSSLSIFSLLALKDVAFSNNRGL